MVFASFMLALSRGYSGFPRSCVTCETQQIEFGGRYENLQLSVAPDIMKICRNVDQCHAAREYYVVLERRGLLEKQIRRM